MTLPSVDAAGPFDLEVLAGLHAACFDEAWGRDVIANVVVGPGAFGLLARVADEPAGFVLCRAASEASELLALGVVPRFRRAGVGRALLDAALASARQAGAVAMALEVAEDNHAASALYTQAGFAPVGRRPGYYRRAGRPTAAAVMMRRGLGNQALRRRRM